MEKYQKWEKNQPTLTRQLQMRTRTGALAAAAGLLLVIGTTMMVLTLDGVRVGIFFFLILMFGCFWLVPSACAETGCVAWVAHAAGGWPRGLAGPQDVRLCPHLDK